jgi:hypothetical protein
VFREVCGPGYVDRTMATWLWQYRDNPEGHRIWLAVAKDGTIAAQYAGVPLRVDTPHGEEVFVHCVDSMTHPEWRQGLKRKGLFVLTCEPFWAESKARGDALFYGFPVDAAFRIGQRYLKYVMMTVVDYLIRDGAAGSQDNDLGLLLGFRDAIRLFGKGEGRRNAQYDRRQQSCCRQTTNHNRPLL